MAFADDIKRALQYGPERVMGEYITVKGTQIPCVASETSSDYGLERGGRSVNLSGSFTCRNEALGMAPIIGTIIEFRGKRIRILTAAPDSTGAFTVFTYTDDSRGA